MAMTNATSIASKVRSGRLKAVDVVTEAIDGAIESHDGLNAFTLIDRSGAIARAQGIDMLVGAGKDPGPLAGVPIALKDLIDQTGLPNTLGSSFEARVAENSATVVRRLGAQGAVIIGRTGLHEFAFGFTSENPWFGPVRNPWDPTTSPGGSSGGSAVAVAAGITPIAIGTDTGGSVRVPAAMCGIFGLKVTHGRVPLTGVYPLIASLDTVGPLARTVDDITVAYLAMAGHDPADGWSHYREVVPPTKRTNAKVTIGVVEQWANLGPSSIETRHAIAGFLDSAAKAGLAIEVVSDETLSPPKRLANASGAEILGVHGDRFSKNRGGYGEDLQERLDQCADGTPDDMVEAAAWAVAAANTVDRLAAKGIDLLIAPTVGGNRKVIGEDTMQIHTTDAHASESFFHRRVLASFTAPINRIGLPSLAAPIAQESGLPFSVQLIAPKWHEHTILEAAKYLESSGVLGSGVPPKAIP